MSEGASSGGDPSAEPLRRWQERGDLEALDQLLRLEVSILKQMIRSRKPGAVAGSVATSDIAQEAVLRLLKVQSSPTFDNPRALRGYLWKSAWHLLVQRFEKKKTVPLDLESDDLPGLERLVASSEGLRGLDRSERSAAIGLAMNLLAHEDRELIRLVYFAQQDIETAGRALGLTRGAANSRLVRARRELARALASWSDLIG
jgi:RNA polymerase sigma factor (sigma-70 family)